MGDTADLFDIQGAILRLVSAVPYGLTASAISVCLGDQNIRRDTAQRCIRRMLDAGSLALGEDLKLVVGDVQS